MKKPKLNPPKQWAPPIGYEPSRLVRVFEELRARRPSLIGRPLSIEQLMEWLRDMKREARATMAKEISQKLDNKTSAELRFIRVMKQDAT